MYALDSPRPKSPEVKAKESTDRAKLFSLMEAAKPIIIELLGGDEARSNYTVVETMPKYILDYVRSNTAIDDVAEDHRAWFVALSEIAALMPGPGALAQMRIWLRSIEDVDRQALIRAKRQIDQSKHWQVAKADLIRCPKCNADCSKAPVIAHPDGGVLHCLKCDTRLVSTIRYQNIFVPKEVTNVQIS